MTTERDRDSTTRLQLVVELLEVLRDHFGSRDARGRALSEVLRSMRSHQDLLVIECVADTATDTDSLAPSALAKLLEILTANADALPTPAELHDLLQRKDTGPERFCDDSTPESRSAWTEAVATYGASVAFDVVRGDLEDAIERRDLGQLRRRLRGLVHRYGLLDRPRSGRGPYVTVGGGRGASGVALRSHLDAWHE